MNSFDSHTRNELRQAYRDAWRRRVAGSPLTPLDTMLADVVALHPEYQALIHDRDAALAFETGDASAVQSPFLHLGLHMAVREQLAIDRPPGVRDLHRLLQARCRDAHAADHVLMDALAETLWEAQKAGRPPDEARYLALARGRMALAGGMEES